MVNLTKATDMKKPSCRCILYGQAGIGKTTVAKELAEQGNKVLYIDVDRSSTVLRGVEGIDIITLAEDLINEKGNKELSSLTETVEFIEKEGKNWDIIFFDNISMIEKNMLTYFGRKGKNKGVPSMAEYQQMQFKVYDYTKRILMAHNNVIITAWELVGNMVCADSGESQLRLEPHVNNKIVNYILGLANIVAHYEKVIRDNEEKRFLRLSASSSVYAKDQVFGRKFCKIGDLLNGQEL